MQLSRMRVHQDRLTVRVDADWKRKIPRAKVRPGCDDARTPRCDIYRVKMRGVIGIPVTNSPEDHRFLAVRKSAKHGLEKNCRPCLERLDLGRLRPKVYQLNFSVFVN